MLIGFKLSFGKHIEIDFTLTICYLNHIHIWEAILQPFGYLIPRMKKENLGERRTECLGRKLCSSYKGKEYAYGKGGYSHQSLYEKK